MLFFIHLLFAITYLHLISIRHFKLYVVDYPTPSHPHPPLKNIKFHLTTLFVGTCNHVDFMLFLFSHNSKYN